MSELKPCPFCGGEDIEIVHCEEGCCGAKPRLMECKCGCSLWVSAQNDNEAIATWNTRPNDAKAVIAEDVFLQLAHSHSQMLQTLHNMFHQSTVKHAQVEQGVAEYMQDNGLMEKYFAVCKSDNL